MRKGWFHIISAPLARGLAWTSLMGLAVACSDSLPLSSSADVETSTVIPGTFGGSAGSILISISAPNIVVAGSVINITITATTANGNPALLSTLNYDLTGGTSLGTFGSISASGPGKYILPYTGDRPGTPNTIKLVVNGTPASNSNTIAVIGGPPHSITILQGNSQNGVISSALAVTPQIQVKDVKGNGASNAAVNLQVTAGGGTVSGGQSSVTLTTDSEGKISIPWVMGPALGTNTLTVTANAGTVTNTLTANAYDKPSSVSLSATNTITSVNLSWTAATYTGGGTINYNVQRSTSASGPFSTLSTLTGTTFNDTTAVPSTIYYYQVLTSNIAATSDPSNQVSGALLITNTFSLKTANASSYTLSNSNTIDFTATSCELTSAGQSDANSTAFGLGTGGGVVYGTLADGVQTGMKLGNAGGCDGSNTNCANALAPELYELNSSWTPQWSSLVAYWKLNETSGATSVVDSKGSYTGTATSVTFGGAGKVATSASFNGTTSTINCGSGPPLTTFTTSAWIKFSGSVPNVTQGIVGRYQSGANGSHHNYYLTIDGATHKLAVGFYNGSSWSTILGTNAIWTAGQWYQITGTYDGTAVKLYINGVPDVITSGTPSGTPYTSISIPFVTSIGSDGAESLYYFPGSIDEVALWNVALTGAEIGTIYNTQTMKYSGVYTSRILDALGSQSWTDLIWKTTVPFLKALPDYASSAIQNETSSVYSSLSTSTLMNGIIGLWHLDETSGTSGSGSIIDHSGKGNNGTPTNVVFGTVGKFNKAAKFSATSTSVLSIPAGSSGFTTSAFTESMWVNTTQNCSGNKVIIAEKSAAKWWIGCGGAGYFTLSISDSNNISGGTNTGTKLINDGTWHHVAAVVTSSGVSLYIDGQLQVFQPTTFTGSFTVNNSYVMGNYASGSFYYDGLLDEVAIWNRALTDGSGGTPNEILELYRRGASRIKFQVRSCATADPTCAAAAWQGPDGSANTYFSELNNMSVQAAVSSGTVNATAPDLTLQTYGTPVPSNRYFQYRTILESDSATTTFMPELKSVTIGPTHYDSTSPTVVTQTALNFNSFTTFTDDSASACASPSSVTYNLSPDGTTWYYWNGTTWASGGSATNSNTASVLNTMSGGPPAVNPISQYNLGSPRAVYIKTYLKSDGTHQCSFTKFQTIGT